MAFRFNRNPITNEITKKEISISIIPENITSAVSTSAGPTTININNLTVNGVVIDNNLISLLSVTTTTTPGAEPNKALILDNNKSVTGINSLSCNQLTINNVVVDPDIYAQGTQTNDLTNEYMVGASAGISLPSKALILDNDLNIKGINTLSSNSIIISNKKIINEKNNTVDLSHYMYKSVSYKTEHRDHIENTVNTFMRITEYYDNAFINSIAPITYAYSPKLDMYIAGGHGNSSFVFPYSYDGIYWTTPSYSGSFSNLDVCWSPELEIFVVCGYNNIFISSNGLNWVRYSISTDNTNNITKICWSSFYNMFVGAGVNHTSYSYNGIDWFVGDITNQTATQVIYIEFCKMFLLITESTLGLYRSYDGKKWSQLYTLDNTTTSSFYKKIAYSNELNRILISVEFTLGGGHCPIIYSDDGGYMWNSTNLIYLPAVQQYSNIIYESTIKMFFACSKSEGYGYSFDGLNWIFNALPGAWTTTNSGLILFSKKYGKLIIKSVLGSPAKLFYSRSFNSRPSFSSINFNKSTTNTLGLGTYSQPNYGLSIESIDGKIIKFTDSNRQNISEILLSNNTLTLKGNKVGFNFANNFNGLKLSGVQVNLSSTLIDSFLLNSNSDNNNINSIIVVDSNKNLNSSNTLILNSLNGLQSNNILFTNNKIGIASANKVLIANDNKNIIGINNLSITSEVIIGDTIITNKKGITNKIILDKLYNSSLYNSLSSTNKYVGDSFNANDYNQIALTGLPLEYSVFYSKVLKGHIIYSKTTAFISPPDFSFSFSKNMHISGGSFPIVGNINKLWDCPNFGRLYVLTTSKLYYTIDGLTYISCSINNMIAIASFVDIDYSPQLNLFITCSSSGNNNRIMFSKNGIIWQYSICNGYAGISFNNIKWIPSYGMFLGINKSTTYSQIMYSYDGINWEYSSTNTNDKYFVESTTLNGLEYSPNNNLTITKVVNAARLYGTYNGITWFRIYINTTFNSIKWIGELECFVATTVSPNIYLYSQNGINWNNNFKLVGTGNNFNNDFTYSKIYNSLITTPSDGTASIILTKFNNTNTDNYNYQNVLLDTPDRIKIDNINNRVGIGISEPLYALHLTADSAHKPASNSWATSSDARLKEDIETADIDICYNNIINIPLKKFKWKEDVYTDEQIANDRNKIGWIAQDVEQCIPKAVNKKNIYGIEDCRDLNIDQIIANMYGCVKYLIKKDDELNKKLYI